MLHALPLLISNEIRRELQQRAAVRLAVEWLAVTWLLHSLNQTDHVHGTPWPATLLALLATPLVACLLAPLFANCHEKLSKWLQTPALSPSNAWAWTRLGQALLLVVEILALVLTLRLIARLLEALGPWLG